MTFPDYELKWNGASVVLQKCPWKPIHSKLGHSTAHGYLMCSKFCYLETSNFQFDFRCKTFCAKYGLGKPYMWSLPTPWLDMKTWRFLRTNKNSPLKNQMFGDTVHKIYMLCMFRCADTILLWKWLNMDLGKSKIVRSGNNGCHMSQENVIKFWLALHPSFPGLYSVKRFPEQGFWKQPVDVYGQRHNFSIPINFAILPC